MKNFNFRMFLLVMTTLAFAGSSHSQTVNFYDNTANGTYTFTVANGQSVAGIIQIWGAGGGSASNQNNGNGGGGGNAGGYVRASFTFTAGTYTVVVGQGGATATTAGSNGSAGTASSISGPGLSITAAAGTGGNCTSANVAVSSGNSSNISTQANTYGAAGVYNPGASGSNGGNAVTGAAPVNVASVYTGGAGGSGSGASGAQGGVGAGGGSAGKNNATGGGAGGNGRVRIDFASNIVLPVKFSNIKASEKGTGVQIDWTSYSELNLANYQIERSADGIHFTSVGEVAPRNVAAETQYNYFDAMPLSGTSFYRIRNNDIDGKSGLSNIVKINLNKNIKTIGIYPNPVIGNRVSFQTSDLAKGTYNVEVINAIGTRVFQQAVNHAGGAINQLLNLPTLQSGQYTLRINGTSSTSTHKITILQ